MDNFIILTLIIILIIMLNYPRILRYRENRQKQQETDFKERTNLDLWKLTKLSPGITWLGSDQFHFSDPEFYFDENFLYLIDHNKVIKHAIPNVTEVTRTIYSRNNRRIWEIVINESGQKIVYKIVTNHSLTTNNFSLFLNKINENRNAKVDSEWLL